MPPFGCLKLNRCPGHLQGHLLFIVGYRGVQQRFKAWSTDFYLKTNHTQSYNSQCLAIRDIFAHILHVLQYTTHGNSVETRNDRTENAWGLGWIQTFETKSRHLLSYGPFCFK